MSGQGSSGNVIAAICNVFFPGLGQLVQGRIMAALGFFIFWCVSGALTWVLVGWVLLPIVYLWAIIDAARYREEVVYRRY
jgi:TM2 domain-containing membrane protein YozV